MMVMVDTYTVVKGVGRAPPPSPAWANFSIMMECRPESGRCHSVYSVSKTRRKAEAEFLDVIGPKSLFY
jgi:hypothetical protein